MTNTRDDGSADLELLALARLGLGQAVPESAPPRTGLVDSLAQAGRLSRNDVARVRAYLSTNSVACPCGQRALPSDNDLAYSCPVCQRLFYRRSGGLWQAAKGAPPPTVGSKIGPLELTRVLGKGAQGTVFHARHTQLQRDSAVKILPAASLDDHKRRRFAREVEALGRLNHPSIVKVHATFEVEGSLACELELVTGETLEERIDRTGPLPWRDAVALTAKLARATAHAHAAGVLHRDLKPANVLLREGTGEPLLADFGLSRLTDLASSLTVAGASLGTPFYMAPEAFSGDSSERTDVYGLGTILYQCLTGLPPYRETQLAALYNKAMKGRCEPTNAPDAPAGVEDVRRTAMAPAPEARYPSAEALAIDLEALLSGRAPNASSTIGLAAVARQRDRSQTYVVIALAIFAIALGALVARLGAGRHRYDSADLDTIAGAIAFLEHPPEREDPQARARAQATLKEAARGTASNQSSVHRELDAALVRSPEALELRRARALVDRARGAPIQSSDLAAVGSLDRSVGASLDRSVGASLVSTAADLDAIAGHAAAAGLVGDDALVAARSVYFAHRDSRGAALLYALVGAASGDPLQRDDVVAGLRLAHATLARAQSLERALADVDRVCVLIRDPELRETPEAISILRRLMDSLPQLARDPLLAGSLPVVLEPLGPAIRDMWGHATFTDAVVSDCRRALIALLDSLDAVGIGPRLLLLRELYKMGNDISKNEPDLTVSPERIEAAALDVVLEDPLIAAVALQWVATKYAEAAHVNTIPSEEARARHAIGLTFGSVTVYLTQPGMPTDTEAKWWQHALRRAAVAEAALDERAGELAKDMPTWTAAMTLALDARRRAYELSASGDVLTGGLRSKDAKRVIEILLALGRLRSDETALEFVAGHDVVRIEAQRVSEGGITDPKGALAAALAVRPPSPESLSIAARSYADLGRFEEARATLTQIAALEQAGSGSLYDHFTATRTRQYVETLARRK